MASCVEVKLAHNWALESTTHLAVGAGEVVGLGVVGALGGEGTGTVGARGMAGGLGQPATNCPKQSISQFSPYLQQPK